MSFSDASNQVHELPTTYWREVRAGEKTLAKAAAMAHLAGNIHQFLARGVAYLWAHENGHLAANSTPLTAADSARWRTLRSLFSDPDNTVIVDGLTLIEAVELFPESGFILSEEQVALLCDAFPEMTDASEGHIFTSPAEEEDRTEEEEVYEEREGASDMGDFFSAFSS